MYQQIRPLEAIYGRGTLKRSSFWEDESLANFWGEDRFKHPSCVTDSILKTEKREVGKGDSVITVYAYGYRRMQRLTYVSVWGGDGRSHQVPVYRDEYIASQDKEASAYERILILRIARSASANVWIISTQYWTVRT